ncbi:isopentenyl-diphosphate delta-isomerase [Pseudorhodobacter antarcticus]|jgi:isopentenyl-diphosphate delta-isomerase|uniref:Isopentenyl-diphosphate Delta-isomerase n=1 Tax=Pseudorhodobacter antarcticus TaxID=1077947 RepID=A0A1H8GAK8_9RHOB|nr:isopentenyl-diphosphate Delta-isomerase [Pseudorhodobacter antarcticus]SEN40780.1 isopentenyl-diphosphate delta-isomerase [Pseudorhodobacter antarcticus]
MDLIPAWLDGVLQPVEKLAVHQRGLRHKAISVFVLCGDAVLIQQRAAEKYHTPGLWANTCCTHPHWGEDDLGCANRRLEQELGIKGLDLRAVGEVEYRADVGGGLIEHELVQVFTAQTAQSLPTALNPEEVQAARWVPLTDLMAEIAADPAPFTPWLRIYLDQHRTQIFGTTAQL